MKCRDINNIDISKCSYSPRQKYEKIKNIVAFDTETEKGKCFLIGYYFDENKNYILNSDNPDEILDFLTSTQFENTFNFFYNLSYDFQAIIKTLPFSNIKEIAKLSMTNYNGYDIEYLSNKVFKIRSKKNKQYIKFYDIAQYFGHEKLEISAKKYLGYGKEKLLENDIDITQLSNKRYNEDINYKIILDSYLKRDCEVTKKLAQKHYELLLPYIKPRAFYSQAFYSQQFFLENIDNYYSLPNKEVLQFALNSYQGGRFEIIKRGYFDNSYIYDIKSAYPEQNIKVPNTNKGTWKNNKEYEPEALISIFKINTEIYDTIISPFKYQCKNNKLIYPEGNFKESYVNKKEYEQIKNLGFNIQILEAWHYFDNEPEYPFKFLNKFFNLKEELKKDNKENESMIAKIFMNGFYGKTIQTVSKKTYTKEFKGNDNLTDTFIYKDKMIYEYSNFKAGILFNPIVANEITANTRVKLLDSIKNKESHVIGFQTDSIISDKKLNIECGLKLGDWELEKQDKPIIILGSGVYQVIDEEHPKRKLRGFAKNLDLKNLLLQNKFNNNIKVELTRNHKLKQTLKLKLTEEEKLNTFNLIEKEEKNININFDKKRIWDRDFINCNDVLNNQIESKPIKI